MIRICVLGSGSSGNCTLIATEKTCVLIDLGFGKHSLERRLHWAGLADLKIDAILLTHGHLDHAHGVLPFVSEHNVSVFMNQGTRHELTELLTIQRWEPFITQSPFAIGDLWIKPFAVSHDAADPVGFHFTYQGICGALITDLGEIDTVALHLSDCHWLVLESNHDEEMVKIGSYPWFLKQRLLSNMGHLSNHALSVFLSHQFDGQAENIFLAHISRQNNDPQIALKSASQALSGRLFRKPWQLHLTHQSKPSIVLTL